MSLIRLIILSLLGVYFVAPALSREKSEAFMVYYLNDHVKVVSPDKMLKETFVIIENKTLSKLIGRLEAPLGNIIEQVAIKAGDRSSYSLSKAKGERIFFLPLSPASQEVELIPGKLSYEIPAQNQN